MKLYKFYTILPYFSSNLNLFNKEYLYLYLLKDLNKKNTLNHFYAYRDIFQTNLISYSYQTELLVKYQNNNSFQFYSFLNNIDLINYFKSLWIDIPKTFKVKPLNLVTYTSSINKPTFLKWNNFIMRSGQRYKFYKIFLNSIFLLFQFNFLNNKFINFNIWKYFILLQNYNFLNTQLMHIFFKPLTNSNTFTSLCNLFFKKNAKYFFNNSTHSSWYNMIFSQLNLIFSFYIYKIDKAIYKNSRGKSGKFTFVWKYIPVYKRKLLSIFWVCREIQLSTHKRLASRIFETLKILLKKPTHSWLWKIRKFSLNYIYFNFRKSLAENYKTILNR